MADVNFKMPDVGEGVVEAEIVAWHVKLGDVVEEDQPLLDVMTDKATVELPSPAAGKIVRLEGAEGDMVPVGTVVVVIAADTDARVEEPRAAQAASTAPVSAIQEPRPAVVPAVVDVEASPVASPASTRQLPATIAQPVARDPGARPLAAPAVRQRALDAGLDLSAVPGTGPAGRITHQDLDDFIASGGRLSQALSVAGPRGVQRTGTHTVKMIGLRRKIAENMARSKRSIPHFAYVEELDVTRLEELRQHMNQARSEGQPKLTLLPFLAAALIRALPEFPHANATYDEEAGVLTQHEPVHLGIAAATPNGLMVPVIRHAEALDVWQLAAEVTRLAEAARAGTCTREELTGSTITITSLGPLGGVVSTPVINHPEVAIIGVNKIQERPAFDAAGRVVPRLFMNLSSSFDHRIVDGHDAASLIQRVKTLLENPATIFM